ncbi:hypothetical protein BC830DRAFT_1175320, partial [Chytriomyces sp. MP71]
EHVSTVNTSRVGISLPIPCSATPEFQTTAVSLTYTLRLEFVTAKGRNPKLMESSHVRPVTADDIAAAAAQVDPQEAPHFVSSRLASRIDVEAFECVLAVRVYPNGVLGGGGEGMTFEIV